MVKGAVLAALFRPKGIFMAKHYESSITAFLNQHKKEHPQTEAEQRAGRGRLWDKHIDPELQEGYKASYVPQDPYVYYQHTQA